MNEYGNIESPDYGLHPQAETKKQKHIIIIFAILMICVILGIFIFYLLNIGEVSAAKGYVKENYGERYIYVSSKAVYSVGNCVLSPKERVVVTFQGDDLSVINVVVKNGTITEG